MCVQCVPGAHIAMPNIVYVQFVCCLHTCTLHACCTQEILWILRALLHVSHTQTIIIFNMHACCIYILAIQIFSIQTACVRMCAIFFTKKFFLVTGCYYAGSSPCTTASTVDNHVKSLTGNTLVNV